MTDRRLEVTAENEGDAVKLVFTGELTEEARLEAVEVPVGKRLVVDLSGVRRSSSFGVRLWVRFLARLREGTSDIELVRCSSALVRQFNMVPSMREGARITSVMLPYFCGECDDEREVLFAVEGPEPPIEPPSERCSECGEEMEFDDVPASYFTFWRAPEPAAVDE